MNPHNLRRNLAYHPSHTEFKLRFHIKLTDTKVQKISQYQY